MLLLLSVCQASRDDISANGVTSGEHFEKLNQTHSIINKELRRLIIPCKVRFLLLSFYKTHVRFIRENMKMTLNIPKVTWKALDEDVLFCTVCVKRNWQVILSKVGIDIEVSMLENLSLGRLGVKGKGNWQFSKTNCT